MQTTTGESIAKQLTAWGVPCEFVNFIIAPQLVTYNFTISNYLQLNKIKKLCEPLTAWAGGGEFCYILRAGGFALEIPRQQRALLYKNNYNSELKRGGDLIIGIDTQNRPIVKNIEELTHLLVAGTTGSGKSVLLHNFITSLLYAGIADTPKIYIIDPKKMEFSIYKNSVAVITETEQTKTFLKNLIEEMERRNAELERIGKQKNTGEFKKIIVIIDELADLVLQDEEIKPLLIRLLQKGRASGIHFIIATQSPRAKILDGLTLANLPSRLALTCASVRESILILGHGGAEKLTGKGDAIFKAQDTTQEVRIQAPFTDTTKIKFI